MNFNYAKEKLRSAKEKLDNKGDIKRNLFDAYISFSSITNSDLPENLVDQFSKIKESLNNPNISFDKEQGLVKQTLNMLSEKECLQIKDSILRFYNQVLSSQ
jgi:hypothetical protein